MNIQRLYMFLGFALCTACGPVESPGAGGACGPVTTVSGAGGNGGEGGAAACIPQPTFASGADCIDPDPACCTFSGLDLAQHCPSFTGGKRPLPTLCDPPGPMSGAATDGHVCDDVEMVLICGDKKRRVFCCAEGDARLPMGDTGACVGGECAPVAAPTPAEESR